VESTSQSTDNINKELEKFAYDIAESVVLSMEQSSDNKESRSQQSTNQVHQSSNQFTNQEQMLLNQFWERQQSIPSPDNTQGAHVQVVNQSAGVYHAVPAQTSQEGPYINQRVGMTFQQEERRRQELRRKEEAQQEERRRLAIEAEDRRIQELYRQEQEQKALEQKRLEQELMKRREEERRLEEERQQLEAERKRLEQRKQEEEMMRKREEERRIQEERLRQEAEMKRMEQERQEELKRQEILRYEKLRQEEEMIRQEEIRLEQEMRRKQELLEQQRIQEMMKREEEHAMRMELEQHQRSQEATAVRGHLPKLSKNKSFDHSQDRNSEMQRGGEHLGKVKTGQVHEKRNFWIRSTSADRMAGPTLSPAPRRRKVDCWNRQQKENEDPESRPGSSLGQANHGAVKNLSSGFLSKSKSSTAVMQEEERGRPRQRKAQEQSWTKEKYDQQTNQNNFLKAQDVKTNKVNETITTWGKQENSTSGRTTPVPSRNIGQVFSENRMAKAENEKCANSWRTKTPEPSVKLVNVSVEKSVGSNQNIHISENAHAQMANYLQETRTSNSFSQKQECSMSSMTMASVGSVSQPPPTPERNQSFGVAGRYLSQ